MRDNGFLDIEGCFRLGAALFDVARDTARERPNTAWHPVPGAGHGFVEPPVATEVVTVTADWLTTR